MSDSVRPHGLQPTRLLRPWDFPGKSTGVGCHCLLQTKAKRTYILPIVPQLIIVKTLSTLLSIQKMSERSLYASAVLVEFFRYIRQQRQVPDLTKFLLYWQEINAPK